MIAISIGLLIWITGCLYYALTGKYLSVYRETADRFASFMVAEISIEVILFIIWRN